VAKAGGGQPALAVAFEANGQLRARICTREPCSLDGGSPIAVPEEAARLAASASLRIAPLGGERHAIVVAIPGVAAGRTWSAVVAAPLTGTTPLVPFSGYTGPADGVEGERTGPMVLVRPEGVYVGTEREGSDLCGRPAILAPKALDPKTLTLLPAKLLRLSEAEREVATRLVASRTDAAPPPALLRAAWATSAAEGEPPSALTDANMETAWAEDRGGAGRGEFAVLLAPREVPIVAFELGLPAHRTASLPAVPRELWLATDRELFHVTVPQDPGRPPGARYEVRLPVPVHTGCVAVVFDAASSDDPKASVALSEVWARPEHGASVAELVHTLAGGGPEAEAAAAVLRSSGPEAFSAVRVAFSGFDERARRAALDVLDDAPCEVALPVYIESLVGPFEAQRLHGRSALGRCRASAGPAFAVALAQASMPTRGLLADELSVAAPAIAVQTLLPLLATATADERRAYRSAIGSAARSSGARGAIVAALGSDSLPPAAALDLLRALGPSLPGFGAPAERAFARLATNEAPFRTQFLLLSPAAELSAANGGARAFLRQALSSGASEQVRAQAARALRSAQPFYAELGRALDDPSVRVREASVLALGESGVAEALPRIEYRLKEDSWPLVRAAAARALAGFGPGRSADAALGEALGDESPEVRRSALWGIGARRGLAEAKAVRDRLEDREELPGIRAAAAVTLGLICDTASADRLTERALRLVSPAADEGDRIIGKGALTALGLLHPRDLSRRLAPLQAKAMPTVVRRLAAAVVAMKGRCDVSVPARPVPR
jgi:hypothetical protein